MVKRFIFIAVVGGLGAGCSGKGGGGAPGATIETSAEMKAFVGGLGEASAVSSALKTHGAPGLDTQDMELYDLRAAKVTKKEGECYQMVASAGQTVRAYKLCWAQGKISKVEDLGIQ